MEAGMSPSESHGTSRLKAAPMPQCRNTIQVIFTDLPAARRNWWLVVEPGQEVDLCSVDPGFDVDLYLSTDLRTMTEIWMGYTAYCGAGVLGEAKRNMRAIGYRKASPALDSLEAFDIPRPRPEGRDLLVEVRAVSVNPVDYKVASGTAPEPGGIKLVGYDAAGCHRAR